MLVINTNVPPVTAPSRHLSSLGEASPQAISSIESHGILLDVNAKVKVSVLDLFLLRSPSPPFAAPMHDQVIFTPQSKRSCGKQHTSKVELEVLPSPSLRRSEILDLKAKQFGEPKED